MNDLLNRLDKISLWSLLLVIALLPVFFLPFTKIPTETSKGLLLVVGLTLAVIFWAAGRLSDSQIKFPRSLVLLSGGLVALVFLLSSIFAEYPKMSFFGTMFDIGSFWFIFAGFLLMFMSSVVFRDSKNAKMILLATLASSFVVLVFQAVRLFFPEALSLGALVGKTENILGSWNALGFFAGFSGIISIFMVEFFPLPQRVKQALFVLMTLSILFIAAVNFQVVWILFGIFSLLIFVYKISITSVARAGQEANTSRNFPAFSFAAMMIALMFFMAGNSLGGLLPTKLQISNDEVTPSLSATTLVAKEILKKSPLLGIGPNRFGDAWAMHKPAAVNTTVFWDVAFGTGSGLLPTLASTTGYLGVLSLLAFLVLFIITGFKSIFSSIKGGKSGESVVFFIASLYLLVTCLLYSTGMVIFLLGLAFAGIFIGVSSNRPGGEIAISFLNSKKTFFATLLLVFLIIISAALSFKYIERFTSIPHFIRAVNATDIPTAEASIIKANTLHSNDLYLRTYAQVFVNKLNSLISKGSSITEAEKASLQPTLTQAVDGATLATQYDGLSFLNFQTLGSVYYTALSLGVPDARDKAIEAFTKASTLNPLNPRLKLALASVYMADGKNKEAKELVGEALVLKPDYIDAFLTLSQIAKSEGDNAGAISYAERALSLAPENNDLIQYLDSLKNPGASTPSPKTN